MTHKSSHVIIKSSVPEGSTDTVQNATVELLFGPSTPMDYRMRKIRQAQRLMDRLDHDEDRED